MLWLDWPLWFLLLLQDAAQQQLSGSFEKKKGLLLTRPGNYTVHLGPHSVVMGRERECLALGSAFIGVRDGGLGFLRLTLFVNLKHKEWKFKAWEERGKRKRNSSLNDLLMKATEISEIS